jgi:hypothetical protein
LGFSNSKAGPCARSTPVGDLGHFQLRVDLAGDAAQLAALFEEGQELTEVVEFHG